MGSNDFTFWSIRQRPAFAKATAGKLAVYDMTTNKIKLINIFGNGGMPAPLGIGRVDVTWNACPTEFEKRRRGSTPAYTKHYYTCPPKFRFLERRRVKDHLGSVRELILVQTVM